jgi:hypothetical protein
VQGRASQLSFPNIHPHEAGAVFGHEFGTLFVELLILLHGLLSLFFILGFGVELLQRVCEFQILHAIRIAFSHH